LIKLKQLTQHQDSAVPFARKSLLTTGRRLMLTATTAT